MPILNSFKLIFSDKTFIFIKKGDVSSTNGGMHIKPIISKSNKYVVMCNGEITNYMKLKKDMGLKTKDLRSSSDTEILSHAFDYYGIKNTINIIIFDIVFFSYKNSSH